MTSRVVADTNGGNVSTLVSGSAVSIVVDTVRKFGKVVPTLVDAVRKFGKVVPTLGDAVKKSGSVVPTVAESLTKPGRVVSRVLTLSVSSVFLNTGKVVATDAKGLLVLWKPGLLEGTLTPSVLKPTWKQIAVSLFNSMQA